MVTPNPKNAFTLWKQTFSIVFFQLLLAGEVLSPLHKATWIVAQYTPVQLE